MVRQRVGYFERIGRGWKMTKLGIAVVRADPELMVYTFLSAVFSIVASIAVITGSVGIETLTESETTSSQQDEALTVANLGFIFVGYLIISVITVFWNAEIVASAYERLTAGTNPSFSYGIKQASKCLPQIFVWGIISGTVGLILKILESVASDEKSPAPLRAIAGIAALVLGIAWWMVTFFVVPIIVLEKTGAIDSMKQSPRLFKETWGEDVGSHMGVGVIQVLVMLFVILVSIPLFYLGEIGVGMAIFFLFVGIGGSVLFFTTVESVNRASLYYYAKTGEFPPMAEKMGISF